MRDDIVTRLRMPVCGNYDEDNLSAGAQPCSSCLEAAEEIERLRAENQTLKEEKTYWRLMGRETGGY